MAFRACDNLGGTVSTVTPDVRGAGPTGSCLGLSWGANG